MKNIIKYTVLFFLLLSTIFANACSVCSGNFTTEEIKAYTIATGILAILPIIGMFGLFFWLFKKYKNTDA